jgi:integrase/recombinase XerD
MSPLQAALVDYLAVRRALGYRLERAEKLLGQFIAYLEEHDAKTITVEHAVAWALEPGSGDAWHSLRLSVVRCFASHLHGLDPSHEVPAAEILHSRPSRATPYIYSPEQIASLIAVAGTFHPLHRAAIHQTLIGLLAATGMRIGEALALERQTSTQERG